MTAPSLPEFNLARITEDEATAKAAVYWSDMVRAMAGGDLAAHAASHDPARVLRQCEAFRRIVEHAQWVEANPTKVSHDHFVSARNDLFDLAEVYSDHPDYRWGGVLRITQVDVDEAEAQLRRIRRD